MSYVGHRLFPERRLEGTMDFMERIFDLSPDGGSGSFEMMLLFVPVAGLIRYLMYRRKKRI
jgi:hypothetical protein